MNELEVAYLMDRERRRREADPVWVCSRCGRPEFDDREQQAVVDLDELPVCGPRCLTSRSAARWSRPRKARAEAWPSGWCSSVGSRGSPSGLRSTHARAAPASAVPVSRPSLGSGTTGSAAGATTSWGGTSPPPRSNSANATPGGSTASRTRWPRASTLGESGVRRAESGAMRRPTRRCARTAGPVMVVIAMVVIAMVVIITSVGRAGRRRRRRRACR
jgi:hypothetical protein